jgi:hypothetical protein
MTQRAVLQAEIFEKIGKPLVASVSKVAQDAQDMPEDNPRAEAERTAELLAKSIQVSTTLSGLMDIKDLDGEAESIRVALVALASDLISSHYLNAGTSPDEGDIKRIITALEAVLTFSDNFVVSEGAVLRLKALEDGKIAIDDSQISIQFINTFIPVVNVVSVFSFGKPEKNLVADITDRLLQKAKSIHKMLTNKGGSSQSERVSELLLLKGLVDLYVQCHMIETEKLTAAGAGAANMDGAIGAVWDAFNLRSDMITVLISAVSGAEVNSAGTTGTTTPAPTLNVGGDIASTQQPQPATEQPAAVDATAPPSPPPPLPPPQQEGATPPSPSSEDSAAPTENASPMSFFATGKKNDESGEEGAS